MRTVTLQAEVTGFLASRGAPDGADVKQGDLLYQIDPRDYQAALDQASAQLQRDTAAYNYSRLSQHRNSVLSNDGWVAKDTSDQTTSNFLQSEATLAVDAAAIKTAELRLDYTQIRAPFAGRLSKTLVHEGALISATGTQFNPAVDPDAPATTVSAWQMTLHLCQEFRCTFHILIGCEFQQALCLLQIFWDTLPIGIHEAETGLSVRIPLRHRQSIPLGCF
jgi:multidrug efflux system membrane fusion protein